MKNILILLIALLLSINVFAQHAHFAKSGTIEFEKKLNVYTLISKAINKDNEAFLTPALDAYKKANPQFKTLKSTLSFADNKSLFTPLEDDSAPNFFSSNPVITQNNTIFEDLSTGMSVAQKKVFDATFLMKDSTRKIKWKITDETRDIAGYTCRRANAIVMDSIYVVAFYTTEIPVPGGPESFSGLPGMILGVALPHENMTWFATKVTVTGIEPNTIAPPKKGKPVDSKSFITALKATFKNWGDEAPMYYKTFSL
ncbi:GLPGLI family protein [Mucilaginibacter sp.]|uniref:GLPGLI family protein n=1 Tax=Mucilaginibacter sp. TaxID=1882438 RepID=UPI003D10ECB9